MEPLPRFWQAARSGMVTAWGWSTQSADDALAVANERLAHSLKAIRGGLQRDRKGSYGWAPPREETLQEVMAPDGTLAGIVSRNRYGADVLGTDRLLIADVDVPQANPVARSVRGLFGRKKKAPEQEDPKERSTGIVRDFAAAHPTLGVRTYETCAGLRVIVTGSGLEPKSPEAVSLFEQLDTDRIYVHLCRKYNTCRARLTPKPWRCGMRAPRHSWPPASDDEAAQTDRWLGEYRAATAAYGTCRLLSALGPPPDAVESQLIDLHDRATRAATTGMPLA